MPHSATRCSPPNGFITKAVGCCPTASLAHGFIIDPHGANGVDPNQTKSRHAHHRRGRDKGSRAARATRPVFGSAPPTSHNSTDVTKTDGCQSGSRLVPHAFAGPAWKIRQPGFIPCVHANRRCTESRLCCQMNTAVDTFASQLVVRFHRCRWPDLSHRRARCCVRHRSAPRRGGPAAWLARFRRHVLRRLQSAL
jgi:hypothetical protein